MLAADPGERVLMTARLLDASRRSRCYSPGQGNDVEGIHHRCRLGQLLGGRGLETGEPVHRDDLDSVAELGGLAIEQALNTFFERPGTMSSSLEEPVPSRIGARSMMTVT